MQPLIWQMYLFHLHQEGGPETVCIHMRLTIYTLTVLSMTVLILPSAVCHNIVQRDLDSLAILQDITLVHDIADIMLIRLDDYEVANMLKDLIWYIYCKGCEINFINIQGPGISVTFSGI